MIIDFKEISPGNRGGGDQDRFEQFACDFLETLGFDILVRPKRGADGKMDMIVSELRKGKIGDTTMKWLVSCKHFAHSGASVKEEDESNIIDRVERHKCDGFMGIYSTLPATSLSQSLLGIANKIEGTFFDATRIEKAIFQLNYTDRDRILACYFPGSFENFVQTSYGRNTNIEKIKSAASPLTEEDVLRVTKTAIILLEITKIEEEYYQVKFMDRGNVLSKLTKFSEHSNEKISKALFVFLEGISGEIGVGTSYNLVATIFSLIVRFFPAYESDGRISLESGKLCLTIGSNLVESSTWRDSKLSAAASGLNIIKHIYRKSKEHSIMELAEEVLVRYEEIEELCNQPSVVDLQNLRELIQTFKTDLKKGTLAFPVLPSHIFEILNKEQSLEF